MMMSKRGMLAANKALDAKKMGRKRTPMPLRAGAHTNAPVQTTLRRTTGKTGRGARKSSD